MTSTNSVAHPVKPCDSDSTGICWDLSLSASSAGTLKLSGDLKPGWLGKLSSHLSHREINIISGTARKSGPLCWDASFEIDGKLTHSDPFKDFNPLPTLMGPAERITLPLIKISDFQIEDSTRHGGSIYTEISGMDCIGFLYGIVRMFSFYSLFPTELEISTKGMMAFDRFWLKGIGASVPGKDDKKALYEKLKMLSGML